MIKQIKDFPHYYVDENGNVYSDYSGKLKQLKPKHKRGWLFVRLIEGNKRRFTGIHRLVAECFIPNDDTSLEVNHKNKIRSDNRVENLEWLSHRDNVRYSRCKALKVIHDDGNIEYYSGIEDYCRLNPIWNSSNIGKYIKLYNGYSKKHKVRFEYCDQ